MSNPNDLASRIIRYMRAKKYQVFQGSRYYNIVYIEGINDDGTLNDDVPNVFNDLRTVIEIVDNNPVIKASYIATTEPGTYYTYNPLNPLGAARIKFGQYQAWRVGTHGNSEPHEALVQSSPVTVCRDFNKDFIRTGDKLDTGNFGINQHWGYDAPIDNIYNVSAGCLVGRRRDSHRKFMAIAKSDVRYCANKNYEFYTTVIAGDDLIRF